jgi:hypothetical protein
MQGRAGGGNGVWVATVLVMMLAVSGCLSLPQDNAANEKAATLPTCCKNAERQPQWLVDLVRPIAPGLGTAIGNVTWRKGYILSREDAHQAIRAEIRPLDIVVVSSKGRMSGHTIPGLFGHALIYIGTEAELRAVGIWDHPDIRRFQKDITAGKVFLEADYQGVHLSLEHRALNTDRVVVLRPRVGSGTRRNKALRDYFASVGMPFDFQFDLDTPERTFCTELINVVMPEQHLPINRLYGTRMILPEELPASALNGRSALTLVSYTRATPKGWERVGPADLQSDIAAAWAPKESLKKQ